MAPILAPTVKLNNGSDIPAIGLGTSNAWYEEVNVHEAIDAGYRLIDTTYFGQNETLVGSAVRDKIDSRVIKRKDIFIIGKLWSHAHEPERVEYACRKSLDKLGMDYYDCYLIDCPFSYVYRGDNIFMPTNDGGEPEFSDVDYLDTWKAMENLVEKGLVKSIGVSNFNSEQLLRLLANCKIKPVLNQVECHLGLNQKPMIALCKQHDIVVTAYRPFGISHPIEELSLHLPYDKIIAIGVKYKKSSAQIILRYLIQLGGIPLPTAVSKFRLTECLNVFDFKLSPEDCKLLGTYNSGDRLSRMDIAEDHKYYPFNIEY